MIRICYFITELSIGGAQVATYSLLKGLDRNRFLPSVACLYNGDGAIADRIRGLGIEVHDLGMHNNKLRVDAFVRLSRWLGRQQPHILHTIMFHANIPGRVVGRRQHVPVIVSGEHTMGQESKARHRLNRLTARYADSITCVSQAVADAAIEQIGLPTEKITVIPNGIDLQQFADIPTQAVARQRAGLPGDALIVGAIGRPRPVKGYDYLLAAWPQVAAVYPHARLLFIGDGPDRPKLQLQAAQLGVTEQVIFWGDQAHIAALLPILDVLVVSSLFEGAGIVLMEAMAARLSVVSTAVGGTPEIVRHQETGLLIPARNSDALAAGILQLLADPNARERYGRAGRQRVEQEFDLRLNVALTERLYEQLIRARFGDTLAPVREAK